MPETAKKPAKALKTTKPRGKVSAPAEKPVAPQKNPLGAPTTYNEHLATVICIRIAEGESLRQILKDVGMPAQSTVYEWLLRHPSFAEQYTRAREEQADTLADEIIHIADEQPEVIAVVDKKTGALIEHKLDGAFLQWQKNRIEARKWTAMKLKPKKYGDRVALEGVEGGAAIKTEDTNANKFLDIIRNMEMTKRAG
jgi:hypothetical protein